jgi:DNA-binding NarL/FixJ family response regulator
VATAQPSGGPSIAVLIADDHTLFREGLIRLMSAEPDLRVVGTAADGDETIRLTKALKPDVLLLDLAMPRASGLEVLREVSEARPDTRVVLVTASISDAQRLEALQLGARGVLMKDVAADMLFKCVRVVMQGQYWIGRDAVASLIETLRHAKSRAPIPGAAPFALTPRQVEILKAVATSRTNREIADDLGISEDTVKQHLSAIFDKCGVSNRVELALFAVHHRLLDS